MKSLQANSCNLCPKKRQFGHPELLSPGESLADAWTNILSTSRQRQEIVMPITLACECGRQFKIADEQAGKRAKCPTCGVTQDVPSQEDIVTDLEVVADGPPESENPAASADPPDAGIAAAIGNDKKKTKKKRKKRLSSDEDGPMTRMFMEQARAQQRKEELLASAGSSRDSDDEGWTMFGVHLTAGVVSGAGLLLTGILAMIVIALLPPDVIPKPRLFIAAFVGITLGGITLIKSIFFGEED